MNYRQNTLYISNEIRFYLGLRKRQLESMPYSGPVDSGITLDQVGDADLRNLYTKDNPQWVEAWTKREELRQKHKKDLDLIEAEAL